MCRIGRLFWKYFSYYSSLVFSWNGNKTSWKSSELFPIFFQTPILSVKTTYYSYYEEISKLELFPHSRWKNRSTTYKECLPTDDQIRSLTQSKWPADEAAAATATRCWLDLDDRDTTSLEGTPPTWVGGWASLFLPVLSEACYVCGEITSEFIVQDYQVTCKRG